MGLLDKIKDEVGDVLGKIEEATGKVTGNEALQGWGAARQDAAEGHQEHEAERIAREHEAEK